MDTKRVRSALENRQYDFFPSKFGRRLDYKCLKCGATTNHPRCITIQKQTYWSPGEYDIACPCEGCSGEIVDNTDPQEFYGKRRTLAVRR